MIVCDLCGAEAPGGEVPLTWAVSLEGQRLAHYCETCARDNVRSIEGRLDRAYW